MTSESSKIPESDSVFSARPDEAWRPLRLATLVRLRWMAIGGQIASVLVVAVGLQFELPLFACFGLIGLSALLNIALSMRFGEAFRLSQVSAGILLGFDSLQLGGLLWLTGGLENPFSLLLLAPVSVSATSLRPRATAMLALLTALVASILSRWHLPLPWYAGEVFEAHPVYVAGAWVSLISGVAFIAAYTNRVAHDGRALGQALAATELALSRQQQLQALDGLAAAAAHELGTPLSTIALAAREMRDDVEGEVAEDLDLILSQVGRCRTILARLRSLDDEDASSPFAMVPFGELVLEITQPYENLGTPILHETILHGSEAGNEPVFPRSAGLIYGLGNLIENAVSFANSKVNVELGWDADSIWVSINDDGPGFASELIARLGEPYLTSRPRTDWEQHADSPGGLGLGIFIAKTLLERNGARLTFSNTSPNGHARVHVRWPRSAASI